MSSTTSSADIETTISTVDQLKLIIEALFNTDIDYLVTLCEGSRHLTHFVGKHIFRAYEAKSTGHLARFLYMIHQFPPLAEYVSSMSFNSDLDSPTTSGVYEMLTCLYNNDDSDYDNNHHINIKRLDKCHPILRSMAEELYLVSFGDPEGLGNDIFFSILATLLGICVNVSKVHVPQSWLGWFDVSTVFPATGPARRSGRVIELY